MLSCNIGNYLIKRQNDGKYLRVFTWDFISGEMKYFHFGVWSITSPAMKSNVNRICFMEGWNFVSGRFHFGSHVNNLFDLFIFCCYFTRPKTREINLQNVKKLVKYLPYCTLHWAKANPQFWRRKSRIRQ